MLLSALYKWHNTTLWEQHIYYDTLKSSNLFLCLRHAVPKMGKWLMSVAGPACSQPASWVLCCKHSLNRHPWLTLRGGKMDGAYLPLVFFSRSASLMLKTLIALQGGCKLSAVWLQWIQKCRLTQSEWRFRAWDSVPSALDYNIIVGNKYIYIFNASLSGIQH